MDRFLFQGSPWSNDISLAILNFHESGVMEELETTWIDTNKCDELNTSPATLGLNHMLGLSPWKLAFQSYHACAVMASLVAILRRN